MSTYLGTLATLLLGHMIADFPLQTNYIYQLKLRSIIGLLLHTATHVGMTALLVRDPYEGWVMLVLIGLAHMAIDWVKQSASFPWFSSRSGAMFLLDQLAHGCFLAVLAAWWGAEPLLPEWMVGAGLIYSLIPFTAMFLWLSQSIPCSQETKSPPPAHEESLPPLLLWSKWSGWPLVAVIVAARVLIVL